MNKKIVIIGNGIAALSAAERIRELDQESQIVLFSKEQFPTYNRLELSKRITTTYPPEQIYVKQPEWYKQSNVDLRLDDAVIALDLVEQTVTAEKNGKMEYSHLLLANGGSNFVPPIPGIDLNKVFSLRSLEDARKIQRATEDAKTLLLIGGGLLALELAWQFRQAGLELTIIELFPQLMPRQLDLESARYLEQVIRDHGVELILEDQVAQLIGEDEVTGYKIKNGGETRFVDVAVYSTGMRSNLALYKDSDLAINHGVLVDEHMRTNVPNVYGAGDIAEYNGRVYGLWSAARMQGLVAGENIAQDLDQGGARFEAVSPITNINVFNQVITSLGEIQTEGAVVFREMGQNKLILKKLFFKKELLCGGIFINNQKEVLLVKKAVEANLPVPQEHRSTFENVIAYLQEQL